MTNAGSGYTVAPQVTFVGGGGSGAIATTLIETSQKGVINFTMTDNGVGYASTPAVGLTTAPVGGINATAEAVISADNKVTSIRITNPGMGYTVTPTVTIADPVTLSGLGTYLYGETVVGQTSGCNAEVRGWDVDTKILKVTNVGIGTTISAFYPGEKIVGTASSANYSVDTYDGRDIYDNYDTNDEIEAEADLLLDFTQSNPFGQV